MAAEPHHDSTAMWQAAPNVEVYPGPEALARAAAERVVTLARTAITARGRFTIALAGGSTPRPLYELLATPAFASRTDWSRWHVFWGDERCVPPDDPASNYRMARDALLAHVPIHPVNVHRIAGEDDPEAAAAAYELTLRALFGGQAGPPERSFDLVLLGMGEDGHTASLFPNTPELDEERTWVRATRDPHGLRRVTLTPAVLNAAIAVLFIVAGPNKAARVQSVIGGAPHAPLPVERIHPTRGTLTWMLDEAAASRLRRAS